jgi:hypothetical protein
MSRQLMALLLRLYPRWVRERYGEELLELQRELRAKGDIGLLGSVRDLVAGALRVRPRAWRVGCAGGLAAVAGVAIAMSVAPGGPIGARHRPVVRLAAVPKLQVPCFVSGGRTCSVMGCSEYVDAAVPEAPVRVRPAPRGGPRRAVPVGGARVRCTTYPRVHPQPPVFVGG